MSSMILISIKMTLYIVYVFNFFTFSTIKENVPLSNEGNTEGTTPDSDNTERMPPCLDNTERMTPSSDNTESFKEHIVVMPGSKDDLPPAYEEEALPPTYSEAVVYASLNKMKISSNP